MASGSNFPLEPMPKGYLRGKMSEFHNPLFFFSLHPEPRRCISSTEARILSSRIKGEVRPQKVLGVVRLPCPRRMSVSCLTRLMFRTNLCRVRTDSFRFLDKTRGGHQVPLSGGQGTIHRIQHESPYLQVICWEIISYNSI